MTHEEELALRRQRKQSRRDAMTPEALAEELRLANEKRRARRALYGRTEADRLYQKKRRLEKTKPGTPEYEQWLARDRQYQAAYRLRKLERMSPEARAASLARSATRAECKRLIEAGADPVEMRREQRRASRRRVLMSPERVDQLRAYQRELKRRLFDARNPDRWERVHRASAAKRRWRQRKRGSAPSAMPTGSVLATAAPSPWRVILADLTAIVPAGIDDRDEIVAQAALAMVEGNSAHEAVAAARKIVARSANFYRRAKPIEDCFWL